MPPAYTLHQGRLVTPEGINVAPLHIVGERVAREAAPDAWKLDLGDHLIFPGLVNAHDHLQLNCIPPLPAHQPFPNSYAWVAAFQSHFERPDVAAAVQRSSAVRHWHGGIKNLLCGATSVAHHDPWHPVLDSSDFPVRLLQHFGWSHSLGQGREAGAQGARGPQWPSYGPPVATSFAATPPERPWIIHLAEGTDAIAAGELTELDRMGCLAANTVLVHAVGFSDADVARAIERGASVVWCPASNLSLLGRTIDPRRFFSVRRVALGSDSRLSGARDLLDELRVAATHCDLTPAELLALVSTEPSRVLAWPEVGGLAPGQYADLLVVRDLGGDPYQALLDTQRSAIRAVVRNGAPAIGDIDCAEWFEACGVETLRVRLDGRPKLLARALVGPDAAATLEPGLELMP
jgi:cytosine/adenosine deaminase-related metal-dependent hydrolase